MEPTEKQIRYATAISRILHKPLPKKKTKKAFSEFISNNEKDFKKAKARASYLDDNDMMYTLGMGTWDIDL
jgi:hypothetical protein